MRPGGVALQLDMKLARWVLAALVLTAVVAAPAGAAGPASGVIGLRLLEAPLTGRNDPRAQVYIVDHLAPGTIIHRRIEVSNTTGSPARITLYPSAATIEKGSFLGAEGHTPNELSTWTSVRPRTVMVQAGGVATANVTVMVPPDAPPGEQYGVVWAEERKAPEDGLGITQVSRVGIRLYLSVGPGNPPAADFTIDSLTAKRMEDGRPAILASVHNTGGRALDMNGALKLLHGPSGLTAGPFPASLGTTLAIGETGTVTILLDKELPAGPWDAHISLKSGLLERSAHARITFPASGATAPAITTTARPIWLYIVVVVVAVFLLTLFVIALRRREARDRTRRPPLGPAVQPG